jgi:hypothetical protein
LSAAPRLCICERPRVGQSVSLSVSYRTWEPSPVTLHNMSSIPCGGNHCQQFEQNSLAPTGTIRKRVNLVLSHGVLSYRMQLSCTHARMLSKESRSVDCRRATTTARSTYVAYLTFPYQAWQYSIDVGICPKSAVASKVCIGISVSIGDRDLRVFDHLC